ncbi:hypothetical protein WKI13_09440 [Teredinibacter turnerae]|uniref:hypothetical protein n=1 Tax=Teredinibacter turnerae TaxID=2426 RepID=UPI0003662257|nr:hypothetical protein [Teredinibacter turnerae]
MVLDWRSFLARLNTNNPVLARHLTQWENESLCGYAGALWRHHPDPASAAGQMAAANHLEAVAQRYFGHSVELASQLEFQRVLLTVHHTAPLFHPIALQTLLLAVASADMPQRIPVLATDWIPMDNMFFPRGLLLPTDSGLTSYNLFGKSSRKKLVSQMEGFDKAAVAGMLSNLHKDTRKGAIPAPLGKFTCEFVEQFYLAEKVLEKGHYREQCAVLNHLAWAQLFPAHPLIQLNISDVILPLLVESLRDPSSLIYAVLFDPDVRSEVLDVLEGVGGCWDRQRESGTCFFWLQHNQKMRPILQLERDCLLAGEIEIELTPRTIIELLERGHIIPGVFLVFAQLMFVNRFSCVGGMRQIAYNSDIRDGLIRVFVTRAPQFVAAVKNFPMDHFAAGINAINLAPGRAITLLELMSSPHLLEDDWRCQPLRGAVLEASDYLLALSA